MELGSFNLLLQSFVSATGDKVVIGHFGRPMGRPKVAYRLALPRGASCRSGNKWGWLWRMRSEGEHTLVHEGRGSEAKVILKRDALRVRDRSLSLSRPQVEEGALTSSPAMTRTYRRATVSLTDLWTWAGRLPSTSDGRSEDSQTRASMRGRSALRHASHTNSPLALLWTGIRVHVALSRAASGPHPHRRSE